MTQLATSLQFLELQSVIQLLGSFASTGRLTVTNDGWTACILVREGQIVAASLGTEGGLAALDGAVIGLFDGAVSYADEPISPDIEVLLGGGRRAAYLTGLGAERRRVRKVVPALGLVPRFVEAADSVVTVTASTLQLLPVLASGQTLDQIAREQGLARTLLGAAELLEAGVITLQPAPAPEPAAAPTPEPIPAPVAQPARAEPVVSGWVAAFVGFFGFDDTLNAPPPALESTARPILSPS